MTDDPYVNLANAILAQAIEDAQANVPDARAWLLDDGYEMLVLLGKDIDILEWDNWVKMGCPQRSNFQTIL